MASQIAQISSIFRHNLPNTCPHPPNIRLHQPRQQVAAARCRPAEQVAAHRHAGGRHRTAACVLSGKFLEHALAINLSIQYKQLFFNYFLFEVCQKLSVDDVQMGSQIAPMSFKFGHNLQNTFPHPPNIRLHQVSGACACY